jgi:hypothetical protein
MVHSSALAVKTDSECLTCDGFSLGETVLFASLEFIADGFDDLGLSPRESNSGTAFMGTTHCGSPSLRAMIEDSTEEFYMASRREGGSGLPFSSRHGTGAPTCSRLNHSMARGCSSHSGHDNSPTVSACIAIEH